MWWSRTSPSQSSKRSAKRSWIIGPYRTSPNGSPIGEDSSRAESLATNSSKTDSCTIAVPRDVQRWPAVPNPPNSAPSTARSTSASSITTIGFLPPSSRHGDCRWRPHSSPICEPTALEDPVKPTLSTRPRSSAPPDPRTSPRPTPGRRSGRRPARRPRGTAAPARRPARREYSAGFHTTALPHRIAGTRYQAGTATGKLPAVMIAATPTGIRNVKSCLSGISDGTVCPYRRRPSPRKKSQVSTISWTSPSASGYGLPISRVTSAASDSLLASTSRPTCAITRPRAGAGTAAHSFCAARAARAASTKTDASPSETVATTSDVRAGFVEVRVPPGASARAMPSTMEATCSTPAAPEEGSEAMEDMASHGSWPAPVCWYGELPYAAADSADFSPSSVRCSRDRLRAAPRSRS